MNVFFLIGLLCIKYVTAQFDNPDSPLIGACVNIQVDGADDTLGFAGKHVGFPALDGCYEVSTFQSSVDDLYYLAYHKYEEDGNRPIFVNDGDDSEVWTLGQYDFEGGTERDLFMIGITDEVPGIELVDGWLGVTTDDNGEHVLDSDGDFIFYAITPDELSISCVPGGCGSVSPTPTSPTPSPPAPSPTPTVPSSGSEESPSSDSSVSSVSSDSSDSSDSDDNGNGSFVSSGTKSVPMNVLGVIVFGIVVQLW